MIYNQAQPLAGDEERVLRFLGVKSGCPDEVSWKHKTNTPCLDCSIISRPKVIIIPVGLSLEIFPFSVYVSYCIMPMPNSVNLLSVKILYSTPYTWFNQKCSADTRPCVALSPCPICIKTICDVLDCLQCRNLTGWICYVARNWSWLRWNDLSDLQHKATGCSLIVGFERG